LKFGVVNIKALSAAYYRVSTQLAAHKNVDMERAKSALEQHRSVCVPAATGFAITSHRTVMPVTA